MPRPKLRRRVRCRPNAFYFKPAGIPLRDLEEVVLSIEELEAMRLNYLNEIDQTKAAKSMNVSQPTFHRIIDAAQKKIADALVNGKAIKIEGGDYEIHERKKSK